MAALSNVFRRSYATSAASAAADVVICGGGMVGSALAAALGQSRLIGGSGRKILVLEGGKKPIDEGADHLKRKAAAEYSLRVSAIGGASRDLLTSVGAWDLVRGTQRCRDVSRMNVWDSSDRNSLQFDSESPDRPLCHIVENDVLVAALEERVRALGPAVVEIWHEASAVGTEEDEAGGGRVVRLKDGREIRARLVIGADGAGSAIRKCVWPDASSSYLFSAYGEFGVVGVLEFSREVDNHVAWQKFPGPVALLPLTPTKSSLIWTMPSAEVKRRVALPADEFVAELRAYVGRVPAKLAKDGFPDIVGVSERAGFPLGLGHAVRYCGRGVALVGDAAHRVHPLAGQGVNLGFGDVACLSRRLEEGVAEGAEFASEEHLQRYETERQRVAVPMMLGVDLIQKAYGVRNPLFSIARRVGVGVVDSTPLLKKVFADFAA